MGTVRTIPPRLAKAIARRKAHPLQQFGQAHSTSTSNGPGGCTQTCLQSLIYYWTGQAVTIDSISSIAGYAGFARLGRGLIGSEVQKVLAHFRLPYRFIVDYDPQLVIKASALGPVLIAERYGDWPRKHGLPVWRNGYAIEQGATQLAGFDGAHMTYLLGCCDLYDTIRKTHHPEPYAHDPNHGSPARPEKPAFDRFTIGQLVKVCNSLRTMRVRNSAGQLVPRSTVAWIPTRATI